MKIKNIFRALRIGLGKILLDSRKKYTDTTVCNKLLFLRQDGKIGDYIVSSFVFRELKKNNPDIHIGVLCSRENTFLFEQNPYIDRLYVVKKRHIPSLIKCGLELRQEHYDAVIEPTVFLRNRDLLLLRLINAKNYVGYQKEHYRIFNLNITRSDLHFSEIYKQALEKLGFNGIDTTYDIPYEPAAAQQVEAFLAQNKLAGFIAVNFYGNGSNRRFNPENIKKYLAYLTENTSLPILLLTYPAVTPALKALAEPYSKVFIDESANTIFHSIEYIRHCALLISPDTATIHIAAGLNKPIIGFYSEDQANFTHWQPNSKNTTHILRYTQNINEIPPEKIAAEWLEVR